MLFNFFITHLLTLRCRDPFVNALADAKVPSPSQELLDNIIEHEKEIKELLVGQAQESEEER